MPSTGKKSVACWSHKGSYLQNLGLTTSSGARIQLESGAAAVGFESLTVDGRSIKAGDIIPLSFTGFNNENYYISYNNTYEVVIETPQYGLEIESSDEFLNIRSLRVNKGQWNLLKSHGLLGQTWSTKRWSGKVKEIEGDVDDYLILSDDLFADDFLFNKFNRPLTE